MVDFKVKRDHYTLQQTQHKTDRWRDNANKIKRERGESGEKLLTKGEAFTLQDLKDAQAQVKKNGNSSKALNDVIASFHMLDGSGGPTKDEKLSDAEIQKGLNLSTSDQGRKPLKGYSDLKDTTFNADWGASVENSAYGNGLSEGENDEGKKNKRGDHLISFDEWSHGTGYNGKTTKDQDQTVAKEAFNSYDVDKNGYLGKHEILRDANLTSSNSFSINA